MPKGITQDQVNAAADQLVAAGDKPTVEKVRQVLGTGSPNTIARMLEAWRVELAQRMVQMTSLPDMPSVVGQAFVEIWRLAVDHAQTVAHEALMKDQNIIAADRASLNQEVKVWQLAVEAAQREAADAIAKQAQAQVQLQERDALMEQLRAQQTDLLRQRDRLQSQLEQQQVDAARLRIEHATALEHVRTVEDRAHRQVDEARQDAKALQARWEREECEAGKRTAQLLEQVEKLRKAVHTAEQATAREAGRVAALEATVKQWRNATQPKKTKVMTTKKAKPRARGSKQVERA